MSETFKMKQCKQFSGFQMKEGYLNKEIKLKPQNCQPVNVGSMESVKCSSTLWDHVCTVYIVCR